VDGRKPTGVHRHHSLHCTENTFTFYALWYTGGMGLSALIGAVLGVKYLRW